MEVDSLSVIENGSPGGVAPGMTIQKYEHHGHFSGSLKDEACNFVVPRMPPLLHHGNAASANNGNSTGGSGGPPPFKGPPQLVAHNRRPIGLLPTSVQQPREVSTPVLPGAPDTHSNVASGFNWSQNGCTNRSTLLEDGMSSRIPTLSQVARQQRLNGHSEDYPPNKIEAWTSSQASSAGKTSRPISERIGSFQNRLKSLLNGSSSNSTDGGRKGDKFQKPVASGSEAQSSEVLVSCNGGGVGTGVENPVFDADGPKQGNINDLPQKVVSGCPVTTSTPVGCENVAALTNAIERLNITGFRQTQTPQRIGNEEQNNYLQNNYHNNNQHLNLANNQHLLREECVGFGDTSDESRCRDYHRQFQPGTSSCATPASALQLSDICNKQLFTRDQAIHYGNNTLTIVNEGRNFKRPLNVEKVAPKEHIGPLHRDPHQTAGPQQLYPRAGYGGSSLPQQQQQHQQLQQQLQELENSPLRNSLRGSQALTSLLRGSPSNYADEGNHNKIIESTVNEMTIPKWETRGNWSPQNGQNDPGSDQGKSSSDSGRVTGTPGFMTPKEEESSLWSNQEFGNLEDKLGGGEHPGNRAGILHAAADRESELSSALSLTPPLPPVTPPTSSDTPSESPLPNLKTIKYKVTSERCQDSASVKIERSVEANKGLVSCPKAAEGDGGAANALASSSAPFGRQLGSVRHKVGLALSMDDLGQSKEANGLWSSGRFQQHQWPPPRKPVSGRMGAHQFASAEMLESNCSKFTAVGKKQKFPSRLTLQSDPNLSSSFPDLDLTSCADTESVLDDEDDDDCESSVMTEDVSTKGALEVQTIRRQLEGLETMYSEILKMLGVRSQRSRRRNVSISSADDYGQRSAVRGQRANHGGSFSPLNLQAKGRPPRFRDPRGPKGASVPHHHQHADKRRTAAASKESKSNSVSKRLQRLESHVVTLARSVAHVSSEMRTQHVLFQELESIRRDVSWTQDALKQLGYGQGGHRPGSRTGVGGGGPNSRSGRRRSKDWDVFRGDMLELINPSRVRKLTKFFGDEPPLLRQFLKKLGYEKYASNFENEKIGITELPYLTEDKLQKIGIPMGPRTRILEETQHSFRQDQYKIYIV